MKKIILGFFLFLLLHFENISLGSLKVSIIWKLILTIWLLTKVLNLRFKNRLYLPFLLLSIISLVHIFTDLTIFRLSVNFLLYYLLGVYLSSLSKYKLFKILEYLRFFIIIIFIPYAFLGLESLGEVYDLEKYGGGEGLSGPFANPHTASMILAIIGVVNFFFFLRYSKTRTSKGLNFFIFSLSVYFLVNTYVRTGIAMFIIGIVLILINKIQVKTVLKATILILTTIFITINFINKDSSFYKRMIGESKYNKEESFEQYGSGRGLLFFHGLDIIKSYDNPFQYLFGIGESELRAQIKIRTGNPLATHNGFLDITIVHGFLGLILITYFLYKNLTFLLKSNSNFRILGLAVFFTIITMIFFQDHKRFYSVLILFLINSLILTQNHEAKKVNLLQ